jgi:hypothetical protein
MTNEKLQDILKQKSKLDFYVLLEKYIKASGVTGIINFKGVEQFTPMLEDANELEWLRDQMYPIITKRLEEIKTQFDNL